MRGRGEVGKGKALLRRSQGCRGGTRINAEVLFPSPCGPLLSSRRTAFSFRPFAWFGRRHHLRHRHYIPPPLKVRISYPFVILSLVFGSNLQLLVISALFLALCNFSLTSSCVFFSSHFFPVLTMFSQLIIVSRYFCFVSFFSLSFL